jgi:DNA-binding winged helix-turn-helix (wHTH) protein/Tol biopolymer transport system component
MVGWSERALHSEELSAVLIFVFLERTGAIGLVGNCSRKSVESAPFRVPAMAEPLRARRTIALGEGFELDPRSYQLWRAGRLVKLERIPMEILLLLVERSGELVTREEIAEKVWGKDVFLDTDNSINGAIRKLRRILKDDPERPRFVQTITGKGYRFVAAVPEVEPARQTPPPQIAPLPSMKKFSRGWRWIAAASVALAIVVGFVLRMDLSRSGMVRPFQYEQLTHFADSAVSPSFSADGRMLTFIRGPSTFTGRGEIYVQAIPGGEPVQLTHDGAAGLPKMSPVFLAGSLQIAYTVLGGHHAWNTWIVPALGGGEPRLMLANGSGMTWIDSGGQRRIMFSEYKGIGGVHMGIVTSTESRSEERDVYVPTNTEGMAHRSRISPDGKQVLVAEMERTNWLPCRLTPYDGSSSGKPVGPSPAHCTDAAWSPDGKWMYFSADTGQGFHIWRQGFPTGAPEQVTFGVAEEEGIAFAPDGRSFATSIGFSQSTVWIHDAHGERQISSQGYAYHPSISVDAKKLYYLVRSDQSRHYESGVLYVADLESGSHDLLLPNFLMRTYDIAPDGDLVVFIGEDDTGRTPVWLATLDGRTRPRILSSVNARNVYFAGHDDVIFLGEEQPGRTFLYRVNKNGGGLQKLAKSSFLYGVSPDGKWVSSWEEGPTEETRNSVVVRPMDGGPAIVMCGTCAGAGEPYAPPIVTWSRDQKYLYAHAVPPVGRPQGAPNSPAIGGTYALPIPTGESVPRLPPSGLHDAADLADLTGARVVAPAGVFTGTDPAVFAFQRVTTERNIYRVPVPK